MVQPGDKVNLMWIWSVLYEFSPQLAPGRLIFLSFTDHAQYMFCFAFLIDGFRFLKTY